MSTTVGLVIEIRESFQAVYAAGGATSRTRWINAHEGALAGLSGCQRSCDFHRPFLVRGYR